MLFFSLFFVFFFVVFSCGLLPKNTLHIHLLSLFNSGFISEEEERKKRKKRKKKRKKKPFKRLFGPLLLPAAWRVFSPGILACALPLAWRAAQGRAFPQAGFEQVTRGALGPWRWGHVAFTPSSLLFSHSTRQSLAPPPPPQRTRRRRFKVFFLNDDGDRDWSQTCGIRPSFLFERSLQSLLFWKGWTSSPPPQGDWDPRTLMGPRPRLTSIFFKYGLFVFSSSKMDNKKK